MEERTWTCICHRISDPPCWWCWWIEEFDNPYLDEDPEPGPYEDLEEKYDYGSHQGRIRVVDHFFPFTRWLPSSSAS